jgi:hypothetical protein
MGTQGRRTWVLFCVAVLSAFETPADEVPELGLIEFLSDW